jgi:hypothetical protein
MIKAVRNKEFGAWIAVGALIISIIGLVCDHCQNKKIEDLDYKNKALEFRPLLKIVGIPKIDSFELKSYKKVDMREFLDSSDTTERFVDIPSILTINLKLNMVNAGNSIAAVYAEFWSDTLSGSDKIRDILLDKKLREHRLSKSPIIDYFRFKEIQPGETTDFEFSHTVKFLEEDKFTMHFLFLYKNEAGALYDTYYWARYTTTPIVGVPEFAVINGQLAFRMKFAKTEFTEFLKLLDQNMASKTYPRTEAEDILDFLKRACGKI